jgi:gas vesicle protein
MQNDERLICLLGGIAAGMAAGLLLAPFAGKDTRKRLNRYMNRRVERCEDLLNSSFTKGTRLAGDLKERVHDTIGDAADTARKVTETVIDKAKDVAHEAGKTMVKGGKRLQQV